MKTLSNIIPSPLNINKILNSNYSTSRFATSDYNGEENTDLIKNFKDNIAPNRVSESGEGFYLGGIGEVGLVMQNVSKINSYINAYKGTEIPLDGKYVSSTFYGNNDTTKNIDNVWYYDVSYGMINHGSLTNAYRKLPLYKYDIKEFDSSENDFDEYDDNKLYLENTYINSFNIMDYFYYCQDDTLDNLKNTSSYSFFTNNNLPNNQNIVKYPVYSKTYNSKNVYSLPLMSSKRFDNYYDCEFLVFVPYFVRKKKQTYDIDFIYKNVKLVIKFGNGEIKEVLDPFIKLKDCVIYKFKKEWLFDYTFINNQEIIVSLVDYGTNEKSEQVLVSKKIFFNLFKIMLYQGKYSDYNFRFKYNNYYPLKYPLNSKKKYIELDYVPYENIENYSETILTSTNIDKDEISDKDPYINLSYIYNNYAYLNTYIYHNINEGNNLVEWFLEENGNGLIVDQNPNDNIFTYFNFSIENMHPLCHCKTFTNYDDDGILESNTNIVKISDDDITIGQTKLRNFNDFNVCGVKEIIYFTYEFNKQNIYGNYMSYINNDSLSIFEDYLYIYNNTSNDVKLYFTDESLTLCENTRIINIPANKCKTYRPSKHDDYNIILKNCLLNKYKLSHYKIYQKFINNSDKVSRITQTINIINQYIQSHTSGFYNYSSFTLSESDNNEIVKIPIYDYKIPLLGNIVIIQNL